MEKKYLSKTQIIDQTLNQEGVFFSIKLDSKNKVFRFRYQANDDQHRALEFLGDFIQDKSIDELLGSMCVDVWKHFKAQKKSAFTEFSLDKSLLELRQSLLNLRGELFTRSYDSDSLICRCMKLDMNAIELDFKKFRGVLKDIVKYNNTTLTCANCKNEFEKFVGMLSKNSSYLNGNSRAELPLIVTTSLQKFKDYTHLNLENTELELMEIEFPTIYMKAHTNDQDLESAPLQRALTNFLCSELDLLIETDLTISCKTGPT